VFAFIFTCHLDHFRHKRNYLIIFIYEKASVKFSKKHQTSKLAADLFMTSLACVTHGLGKMRCAFYIKLLITVVRTESWRTTFGTTTVTEPLLWQQICTSRPSFVLVSVFLTISDYWKENPYHVKDGFHSQGMHMAQNQNVWDINNSSGHVWANLDRHTWRLPGVIVLPPHHQCSTEIL